MVEVPLIALPMAIGINSAKRSVLVCFERRWSLAIFSAESLKFHLRVIKGVGSEFRYSLRNGLIVRDW